MGFTCRKWYWSLQSIKKRNYSYILLMWIHPLRYCYPRNLHPILLLSRILSKTSPQHLRFPAFGICFNVSCYSWWLAFSHILHRKPIEVLWNTRWKPPWIDLLGLRDLHHNHFISLNWEQKYSTLGSTQS